MNYITILNILGWIIGSEGVMMLLPIACAAIYQESVGFYFALVAIVCAVIGFPLTRLKAGNKRFYARRGLCCRCPRLDYPPAAGCHPLHALRRNSLLHRRRI